MNETTIATEEARLKAHYVGEKNWLEWGPYLSERQWGTVREDYSPDGEAWDYFPHSHARSRVYRWGEDGIAGISDRHCAICFSVAMWNGQDEILKERLYGLNGGEGNHAEDVKELYYYLDNTPTHSYMKHLYKYPQRAYPYQELQEVNARRGLNDLEYEILDTGIFEDDKYFDVFTEYAKADEDDLLIKITVVNRADEAAEITLMPTLVMRNLWSFGQMPGKHMIQKEKETKQYGTVSIEHPKLPMHYLYFESPEKWLFTHNETNEERLFGGENKSVYVKDLFHDVVIDDDFTLTDDVSEGTKFSPMYKATIEANGSKVVKLRLTKKKYTKNPLTKSFDQVFGARKKEADEFFAQLQQDVESNDLVNIQRQALAGMLWTKQYYHIDMEVWMNGDPDQPPPPKSRKKGRNSEWMTLNNEDIISMPDKWEYPWYAVWDSAFHCVPLAMVDAEFAKNQLILFLREWYMAPNGQIPAYEWAFSDVNPPVHAWAAYQVYLVDKKKTGKGDIDFLKRVFSKLGLNFTWWVNRKDSNENNVFEGGFLGLDNIGVFDRSKGIPGGGHLEQADGTAWMAMYSLNMLQIAIEIALVDRSYEDMCTKYFEHFVYISAALNRICEKTHGNWDEKEGFFYDVLVSPDKTQIPIKVRSLVGLMTMNAVLVLKKEILAELKDFYYQLKWFRNYRIKNNLYVVIEDFEEGEDILLSMVPQNRFKRLLTAMADPKEFLSDYGIRSLSKIHADPYRVNIKGETFEIKYTPSESLSYMFGGNSNWRGPVWVPMNYLIIQSLEAYHKYYGDALTINYPSGSENTLTLEEVSQDLKWRLIRLFEKNKEGDRPVNGLYEDQYRDQHFEDLVLFFEYFHGDNGRGVGASHQTGWTGCVAELIASVSGDK